MGTCVALDCRKNAFLAEFWTFKGSEKLRKNLVFQIFSMSLALISIAFLTPKMDSDRLDMTTKYILFNFQQLSRNKVAPSCPPSRSKWAFLKLAHISEFFEHRLKSILRGPLPKLNFVYWVMISKRFESIFWVKNPLKVSAWNLEKIQDPVAAWSRHARLKNFLSPLRLF